VLLLEAGAPDEEHEEEIYTPVMFPHLFKSDADWEYYTEPQAELNDRRLYQPRGKTLGGSSSTNAQIYNRGIGGTSTTGPHWGTKVGHPRNCSNCSNKARSSEGQAMTSSTAQTVR